MADPIDTSMQRLEAYGNLLLAGPPPHELANDILKLVRWIHANRPLLGAARADQPDLAAMRAAVPHPVPDEVTRGMASVKAAEHRDAMKRQREEAAAAQPAPAIEQVPQPAAPPPAETDKTY